MDMNQITTTAVSPGVAAALKKRSTIVDIHTHLWGSAKQLGGVASKRLQSDPTRPWDRTDASFSAFEEAMAPVEYAIILGFESQRLGASIPAGQVAQYASRDPSRYLGFAGLDPLADSCRDDLDQALELGMVGVVVSPSAQDFHPCHTRAMRLYERCEASGLPVFIHPDTHWGAATNLEYAQPHLYDEPARAFPNLRWVWGQVGHPWLEQALMLIGKHQHMYADVSHLTRQPWLLYNTLVRAHESGMIDKLLFGSDFPFCTPEDAILAIYSINTLTHGTMLPTIPREQLRGVVERDALTCLGVTKPKRAGEALADGDSSLQEPPQQSWTDSTQVAPVGAEV